MKKMIALMMAAMLLCTVFGAAAEEGRMEPLYATVGEAMAACAENRVIAGGVPDEYYAVVTEKDGKSYRSVAYPDEKMKELNAAIEALDYEAADFFEKHEAAMTAADDYLKTLPIAYSEEFTAQPLTEEEMAAMHGKTISQLNEEGFETGSYGTEPGATEEEVLIVFSMRWGVFDYGCEVDADFDRFEEAQEQDTCGDLVVKDVKLKGITESGFDLRFHADGTVEEPEDPFAEMNEVITEIGQALEKVLAGEKLDMEAFAAELKEKYPEQAELIDMYMELYRSIGAEALAAMLTPAQ